MSARQTGRSNIGAAFPIFAKPSNARRLLGDSIISVPPSLGASYTDLGPTGNIVGRTSMIQSIPPVIVGIAPPTTPTTGNNLGSCVQVYANTLNNVLNFRTLCAGPNVTIQQDVPAAGDILISASGGSQPAPPDNVNLYVSALGSDTTGLGTLGDPYATIQYAAQQLRKTGYNVTARISVIDTSSSAAFLTVQNSIVDLDTGPFGKQQYPLIVQGVSSSGGLGRVTVQNDVVSASTPAPDSPSNCVYVTGVTGGYSSAQQGQILRFTSGADVTNVPLPAIGPPTLINVESFIGNITTTTNPNDTLILAYTNSNAPAAGDTYTVENLTTSIYINGFALFFSPKEVTFYNLDISSTNSPTPISVASLAGSFTYLIGVRFRDSVAGPLIVVSTGAQSSLANAANAQPPAPSPSTNSILGIALISTAATLEVLVNGSQATSLYYAVMLGLGGSVAIQAGVNTVISQGYSTGTVALSVPLDGGLSCQNLFLDGCPGPFALSGGATVANIHFKGASAACDVQGGGSLSFSSNNLFTACGTLINARNAFVDAPQGLSVSSTASPAIFTMFTLNGGAFVHLSALTGSNGGPITAAVDTPLLSALNGSTFIVDGALTYAPTRALAGPTVALQNKSTAQFGGGLSINGGASDAVILDVGGLSGGSYLGVFGSGLTATNFGQTGVDIANGSMLVASTITSTGNFTFNIRVKQATLLTDSDVVAGPGNSGLDMSQSAVVSIGGALTVSTTIQNAINVLNSTLCVGNAVTANLSSLSGISLVNSQVLANNNLTATGNGRYGVSMQSSALLLPNTGFGAMTLTGNGANGLNASAAFGSGAITGVSQIYAAFTIDCSNTLATAGDGTGLVIDNTVLTAGGSLTANNCAGSGAVLQNGSRVHVGNLITANQNAVQGLIVSGGASLASTGISTASNAAGDNNTQLANIFITGASNVQTGQITTNSATFGFGLRVVASQLACASISADANQWDGLVAQASQVSVSGTGSFTNSVQGTGVSLGYSPSGSVPSASTPPQAGGAVSFGTALTCTGNAGDCIFVASGGFLEAHDGTTLSTATDSMITAISKSNVLIEGFSGIPITLTDTAQTASVTALLDSSIVFRSPAIGDFVMTAVSLNALQGSKITVEQVKIDWSGVTVGGTLITSDGGSQVYFLASPEVLAIAGGPSPTANNQILCSRGSSLVIQTANISQVPITIETSSRCYIANVTIDCTGGPPALDPATALIDCDTGSTLSVATTQILGSSGVGAPGQDGIRVENASHAYVTTTSFSTIPNNGLTIANGSDATLDTVTNSGAIGNFGAQLEWGSRVTGLNMSGGVTGASGDLQIGGKSSTNTWAGTIGTQPMTSFVVTGANDSSDWATAAPNCQNCQVSIQS